MVIDTNQLLVLAWLLIKRKYKYQDYEGTPERFQGLVLPENKGWIHRGRYKKIV